MFQNLLLGTILALQKCVSINIERLIDNQSSKHEFYLQQTLFTYELGSILAQLIYLKN